MNCKAILASKRTTVTMFTVRLTRWCPHSYFFHVTWYVTMTTGKRMAMERELMSVMGAMKAPKEKMARKGAAAFAQ